MELSLCVYRDDREQPRLTTTFELVPLDFHLYSVSSMDTDPLLEE